MKPTSVTFYSIDDKLINQASKFILLKKYSHERKEFKKITPSYLDGVDEICRALQAEFADVSFNYPLLAIILYELVCDFNSKQTKANQISKITPSLVKGANKLAKVIEAFKKHPVNISAINFKVRDERIQYDHNTKEKIISNLKSKKAYNDNSIKIEGFELINEILKFIASNEKQFKVFSDREQETLKPKYEEIKSATATAAFRKISSQIIYNFLKASLKGKKQNYHFTLGGKLQALIGLMPKHHPNVDVVAKKRNDHYRAQFKKDLQLSKL